MTIFTGKAADERDASALFHTYESANGVAPQNNLLKNERKFFMTQGAFLLLKSPIPPICPLAMNGFKA